MRYLQQLGVSLLIGEEIMQTLHTQLENGLPLLVAVDTSQLTYWDAAADHAVVVTGIDKAKKYAYISVLDHGPGIPENQLERLFQPFTQGDLARGSEGSGLGLAIIKRIVDMHNGKVVLKNRPEGGLEAKVSFLLKH